MTDQYRATPNQWFLVEDDDNQITSCILELRSRVEALEAAQHTHTLDASGFSEEQVQAVSVLVSALQSARATTPAAPPAPSIPAPADSLVERIEARAGGDARTALRVVAAWLDAQVTADEWSASPDYFASMLREEASR